MHAEIEALRNEVANIQGVVPAITALIKGYAARQAAALDDGDIQAARDMTQQLHDSAATLASSVVAGTPAASPSDPMSNNNPSPGLPGPPADQSPNTANPVSPDAVPQATGVNATPAAADAAAASGDLPDNTPPGAPATA